MTVWVDEPRPSWDECVAGPRLHSDWVRLPCVSVFSPQTIAHMRLALQGLPSPAVPLTDGGLLECIACARVAPHACLWCRLAALGNLLNSLIAVSRTSLPSPLAQQLRTECTHSLFLGISGLDQDSLSIAHIARTLRLHAAFLQLTASLTLEGPGSLVRLAALTETLGLTRPLGDLLIARFHRLLDAALVPSAAALMRGEASDASLGLASASKAAETISRANAVLGLLDAHCQPLVRARESPAATGQATEILSPIEFARFTATASAEESTDERMRCIDFTEQTSRARSRANDLTNERLYESASALLSRWADHWTPAPHAPLAPAEPAAPVVDWRQAEREERLRGQAVLRAFLDAQVAEKRLARATEWAALQSAMLKERVGADDLEAAVIGAEKERILWEIERAKEHVQWRLERARLAEQRRRVVLDQTPPEHMPASVFIRTRRAAQTETSRSPAMLTPTLGTEPEPISPLSRTESDGSLSDTAPEDPPSDPVVVESAHISLVEEDPPATDECAPTEDIAPPAPRADGWVPVCVAVAQCVSRPLSRRAERLAALTGQSVCLAPVSLVVRLDLLHAKILLHSSHYSERLVSALDRHLTGRTTLRQFADSLTLEMGSKSSADVGLVASVTSDPIVSFQAFDLLRSVTFIAPDSPTNAGVASISPALIFSKFTTAVWGDYQRLFALVGAIEYGNWCVQHFWFTWRRSAQSCTADRLLYAFLWDLGKHVKTIREYILIRVLHCKHVVSFHLSSISKLFQEVIETLRNVTSRGLSSWELREIHANYVKSCVIECFVQPGSSRILDSILGIIQCAADLRLLSDRCDNSLEALAQLGDCRQRFENCRMCLQSSLQSSFWNFM